MTTTDTIAGLRAARILIEKGWTQKYRYRLASGRGTNGLVNLPDVVAFCPDGACWAVATTASRIHSLIFSLETTLERDGLCSDLPFWNDAPDRTQADVLALFDRTIARLEAEATS